MAYLRKADGTFGPHMVHSRVLSQMDASGRRAKPVKQENNARRTKKKRQLLLCVWGARPNNERHPTCAPTGKVMCGRAPWITARYPPGTTEIRERNNENSNTGPITQELPRRNPEPLAQQKASRRKYHQNSNGKTHNAMRREKKKVQLTTTATQDPTRRSTRGETSKRRR